MSLDGEVDLLLEGDLEIHGRIMPASNATFLAEAVVGEQRLACVYKPVAGERPLWDFPDGTLAGREVAAYLLSEALGWDVVPRTILRDGPHGPGMVQVWCEPDEEREAVDLVPEGAVPAGFLRILDATDGAGRAVSLVHEDSAALRLVAVFDVVANNADRKGGHVLAMPDGHRYGVDHGICFHVEPKLRTVLWGWGGDSLRDQERDDVARVVEEIRDGGDLALALAEHLTRREVRAVAERGRHLLSGGRLPRAGGEWPSIPWPAF